jgi:electron transport complex protein RnfE
MEIKNGSDGESASGHGTPVIKPGARKPGLRTIFIDGIFSDNPTFRLILGTCPVLAVTTSAINGVGMGISATAVLVCSNIVISMIRNFIPDSVRIPAFITVIAGFVTIVDLILHAFTPDLYSALGIFIPLIVVNCIILARAEMFASKNGVVQSAADGLGMGCGFTAALILIGSLREFIGNGTIFGFVITQKLFTPAALLLLPPGGFIAYGSVMAVINKITHNKTPVMSCDGCTQKCGVGVCTGVNATAGALDSKSRERVLTGGGEEGEN